MNGWAILHAQQLRGFPETLSVVYPHLQEVDFTTQAAGLGVPERYFNLLQAPPKEVIWIKSGHSMTDSDTIQFVDVMAHGVL